MDDNDSVEYSNRPLRSSFRHTHSNDEEDFRKHRSVRFNVDKDIFEMEKTLVNAVEQLGKCSLWLILMLVLSGWPLVIVALQSSVLSIIQLFNFKCFISDLTNSNWNLTMQKNISMPRGTEGKECLMYDVNYKWLSKLPYPEALDYIQKNKARFPIRECKLVVCDHNYFREGYTFADKAYLSTVCTEYLQNYLWVSGWCGRCVNDLIMGVAADIYGRKLVIQINILMCFTGLLVILFTKSAWVLIVGRVLSAGGGYSCCLVCYIYFTEMCNKNIRPLFCQIIFVCWGIGYLLAPILLYHVQKWVYLRGCIMPLVLVCFFAMWYMPESPRWLISRKKYLQAQKVINGIDKNLLLEEVEYLDLPTLQGSRICKQFQIFEAPVLGYRIVKSAIMYATSILTYYASRREAGYVDIDIYNYFLFLSLIALMHPLSSTVLINFMGRRLSVACVYALLSIFYCTVLIEGSHRNIEYTLFMLILNFATISNNITMQHVVEMYPVPHSGTVLGFCTSLGSLSVVLHNILDKDFGPLLSIV
ncbi:hypothetical protein ILUMI_08747 [Ignelater luminosus]|uniref:Uncharacterized protein n=1 Tax=Ignelater luminosus TaxID=2038154 RepID=A0A8K0GFN9_IGNLU|nr:hypothetical protein ILUMI_08747 [Ignelater luminosus]